MELTGMNFVSRAGLSALDETDIMAAKNSAEALLAVSMDRALAGFRENSGLGTFGAMRFKDWETGEFSSPCLGLYLCACKNAYLSGSIEETTAQKLLERLHDIVEALKECQDVFGTGIIFGTVSDTKNPESVFDASEKGCHEGALQIAGPWHTLGRLIDGLSELASLPCRFDEDLPAAEYVKNTSLDILNRLVDWVFFRASGWNEVTLGLVKGTECGALNESLYHAYSVSEKETHLRAAELFDDTDFYNAILSAESAKEVREKTDDPVSAVKFLGTLRKYISTHEKKNLDYATAFWEYKNVTKNIDPIELSDLKLLAQMLFEATGSASYANDFEELSSLSSGQTSDFIFADPCEGAMYSGSGMIAVSRYIPFVYEDDYQKLEVTRSSEKEQTYKILFKRTFTGTLSLRIPSGLEGDPEILIDGEEYGFAVAGAKKKTKGFALVAGPFDVGCEVEIRLPGLSTRSDLLSYAGGTYTAPGGDAYISNTYIPKDDSYAQNAYTSAGDAYVQNAYTSVGDAYAQNAYAPKGDTYVQNAYTSPKNAINGADTGAPVTEYSDLYKNENYQSFFTAPDHSVAEAGTIESYGMLDGYKGDDIGSPSQPQNDGFGYGIPSQPQYDSIASDAPSYEKTAYGTPPYDAPSYEKTAYGTPPYDAPSYEKTAYGMPPYDAPAYEKSSYENSAYKAAASENNNGQKVLRAPFELCADAGEVLYSGSRKRFLIKLPQDYSSGELSVSVNADFANIELDSNICPTGSIVLRVDERHFTGHQLRLYTTDDYRDYVDYEIAIMKTGPAYEDGSGQTASANSYREVTGSFAGELCYKIDCLRDEYEDGPLGSYNSRAFQMYGIDPDTGYFWGITGSNSAKCYEFELEDGSYELKLSLMAPEWCHDKPSIYQNPNRSNERLLGENLDSESDNLCYRVNVRDGKLVIGIISDSNEVTIWRLEIRVLSTIAAANDYKPLWETKAAPEFKYTASEPEYNFTAPEPEYRCTAPEPEYRCTAPEPEYRYTTPEPEQPAYIPPEFSYTEPEYRYTAPEPEYRYTAPEPEYNFTATEPAYTAAETAYLASEAAFGKAVAPEPEQPAYIPPEFSYTVPEPEKPAPAKTVKEETVAEYAVPKTGYAPKPNFIRIVPTIAQGAMPQIRVAEPLIPKPKVTVMHSAEHNAEEGIAQEASKITVETGSGKKISTVAKVTGSIAGAVAIIGGIVSLFKDKD